MHVEFPPARAWVLSAACLVALASGFVIPKASADQISDLKAQASALASRIQTLGRQEAALGEQYDGDQLAVQALNAKVARPPNRWLRRRRHDRPNPDGVAG